MCVRRVIATCRNESVSVVRSGNGTTERNRNRAPPKPSLALFPTYNMMNPRATPKRKRKGKEKTTQAQPAWVLETQSYLKLLS